MRTSSPKATVSYLPPGFVLVQYHLLSTGDGGNLHSKTTFSLSRAVLVVAAAFAHKPEIIQETFIGWSIYQDYLFVEWKKKNFTLGLLTAIVHINVKFNNHSCYLWFKIWSRMTYCVCKKMTSTNTNKQQRIQKVQVHILS